MPAAGTPAAVAGLTPRGQATRERIVTAAAALMYRRGVAGTSLDDVRAATDTSKSQLYHYFTDKSALVGAVIGRQVQQVLQAQQPELDSIDSMAALRRWRDRIIALNEQTGAAGCPLGRLASELSNSDPSARADLVTGFTAWQERLAAGLRTMHRQGHLDTGPDPLAAGLLAALQGGLLLTQATHSVAPLQAALDLALDGISAHVVEAADINRG